MSATGIAVLAGGVGEGDFAGEAGGGVVADGAPAGSPRWRRRRRAARTDTRSRWRTRRCASGGSTPRPAAGQVDVERCRSSGAAAVPNFTPARKNTVGASGSAARAAGSQRSAARVATPWRSKSDVSCRVRKRDTASRSAVRPSGASARCSMRLRCRPSLPPAPRTRTGPGVRASTAVAAAVGPLRNSSTRSAGQGRPAGAEADGAEDMDGVTEWLRRIRDRTS
jgi:hypothetical protein